MMAVLMFIFFFFKQKTAYEMRISDWSSDVCSSDLAGERFLVVGQAQTQALFEQEARRMAEALQQLRRLDGQPGLVRLGEQTGEGLRLGLRWLGERKSVV